MMDKTGQSADDQCSAEAERRHQELREFREFAELSPTERCLALLNFTALFAAVLHFVVRLTVLGAAAVPVDDNNNKPSEDKTHSSSVLPKFAIFKPFSLTSFFFSSQTARYRWRSLRAGTDQRHHRDGRHFPSLKSPSLASRPPAAAARLLRDTVDHLGLLRACS